MLFVGCAVLLALVLLLALATWLLYRHEAWPIQRHAMPPPPSPDCDNDGQLIRLETIINATNDAVVAIDRYGNIHFWNNAATHLFGYTKSQATGQNFNALLLPKRYSKRATRILSQLYQPSNPQLIGQTVELLAKQHNGAELPIEVSIASAQIEGEWYIVGVIRDITDRKRAARELQQAKKQAEMANRAKSEFLANMSHEIRTPMNAILGFSEILNDVVTEPQQREYLATIYESGKSLLNLINDILDFAKIQAGELALEYTPVNLRQLFTEVERTYMQKIQYKQLNFSINMPDSLPELIVTDADRFKQILGNLVSNAVKFTDNHGCIAINVWQDPLTDTSKYFTLHFSVADNGIGIPFNQQEKIFETFERQTRQDSSQYDGTGLGLAITKHLTNMMGGQIHLASQPNGGSTFTVTFHKIEMVSQLPYQSNPVQVPTFNTDTITFDIENTQCNTLPTLSPEQIQKLAILLDSLHKEWLPEWQQLSENSSINVLYAFGERIKQHAEMCHWQPLAIWGEQLASQAILFDMTRLPVTLHQFPKLIADIEQALPLYLKQIK